jgi:hypothetical protein
MAVLYLTSLPEQSFCNLQSGACRHPREVSVMKRSISFPFLAASILGFTATAAGADDSALPYAAEVDSCIAAVNSHLDLSGAKRVRHFVSEANNTGLGYALTIETSVVYDGAAERYEAYCVARGTNAPSTFRIEPIGA